MLLELKAANQRLRELGIRVTIKYTGQWLYPRAVLPPKPGGSKIKPYCQEVTLPGHGLPATVTGWKKAEKVAARLWSSAENKTLDFSLDSRTSFRGSA